MKLQFLAPIQQDNNVTEKRRGWLKRARGGLILFQKNNLEFFPPSWGEYGTSCGRSGRSQVKLTEKCVGAR